MMINPTSSKVSSDIDPLFDAREDVKLGWDHKLRCGVCHGATITAPITAIRHDPVSVGALNRAVMAHWAERHGYDLG